MSNGRRADEEVLLLPLEESDKRVFTIPKIIDYGNIGDVVTVNSPQRQSLRKQQKQQQQQRSDSGAAKEELKREGAKEEEGFRENPNQNTNKQCEVTELTVLQRSREDDAQDGVCSDSTLQHSNGYGGKYSTTRIEHGVVTNFPPPPPLPPLTSSPQQQPSTLVVECLQSREEREKRKAAEKRSDGMQADDADDDKKSDSTSSSSASPSPRRLRREEAKRESPLSITDSSGSPSPSLASPSPTPRHFQSQKEKKGDGIHNDMSSSYLDHSSAEAREGKATRSSCSSSLRSSETARKEEEDDEEEEEVEESCYTTSAATASLSVSNIMAQSANTVEGGGGGGSKSKGVGGDDCDDDDGWKPDRFNVLGRTPPPPPPSAAQLQQQERGRDGGEGATLIIGSSVARLKANQSIDKKAGLSSCAAAESSPSKRHVLNETQAYHCGNDNDELAAAAVNGGEDTRDDNASASSSSSDCYYNPIGIDDIVAYEYLTHHGKWKWGVARVIRRRGKRAVDLEPWDAVGVHKPLIVADKKVAAIVATCKSRSSRTLVPAAEGAMPAGLSGVTMGLWKCPLDIPGCAVPISTVICTLKEGATEDETIVIDESLAKHIVWAMWCQRQPLVVLRVEKAGVVTVDEKKDEREERDMGAGENAERVSENFNPPEDAAAGNHEREEVREEITRDEATMTTESAVLTQEAVPDAVAEVIIDEEQAEEVIHPALTVNAAEAVTISTPSTHAAITAALGDDEETITVSTTAEPEVSATVPNDAVATLPNTTAPSAEPPPHLLPFRLSPSQVQLVKYAAVAASSALITFTICSFTMGPKKGGGGDAFLTAPSAPTSSSSPSSS